MKRFALPLIAASLGATLATTALASGPTAPVYEPPVMLPSPVAVYDWTGFYGGLTSAARPIRTPGTARVPPPRPRATGAAPSGA